jgi:hypothetical protein
MHVCFAAMFLLAAWKWGDWRNWMTYHSTMLYVVACDLLYLFLTANHYLWRYIPDGFLPSYSVTEMLHAFITLPATTLIFLSKFPAKTFRIIMHFLLWMAIFVVFEIVLFWANRFEYQFGWGIIWSIAFDLVMFPMILLHHKKPLLAYGLSVITISYLLWKFNIPTDLPIEERP